MDRWLRFCMVNSSIKPVILLVPAFQIKQLILYSIKLYFGILKSKFKRSGVLVCRVWHSSQRYGLEYLVFRQSFDYKWFSSVFHLPTSVTVIWKCLLGLFSRRKNTISEIFDFNYLWVNCCWFFRWIATKIFLKKKSTRFKQ